MSILDTLNLQIEQAPEPLRSYVRDFQSRRPFSTRVMNEQLELKDRAAQLEALVAQHDRCWHCHDVLIPEPLPHCETCPEANSCDRRGCTEPGCAATIDVHEQETTPPPRP